MITLDVTSSYHEGATARISADVAERDAPPAAYATDRIATALRQVEAPGCPAHMRERLLTATGRAVAACLADHSSEESLTDAAADRVYMALLTHAASLSPPSAGALRTIAREIDASLYRRHAATRNYLRYVEGGSPRRSYADVVACYAPLCKTIVADSAFRERFARCASPSQIADVRAQLDYTVRINRAYQRFYSTPIGEGLSLHARSHNARQFRVLLESRKRMAHDAITTSVDAFFALLPLTFREASARFTACRLALERLAAPVSSAQ